MECASDTLVGGVRADPPGSFYGIRSVTFDVPTAGFYHLRVESEGDVRMQIGPCHACPWQRDDRTSRLHGSETRTVELDMGTHFARVQARSDAMASFTIELDQDGFDEP